MEGKTLGFQEYECVRAYLTASCLEEADLAEECVPPKLDTLVGPPEVRTPAEGPS
jgi:hypothetical protein